MLHNYNYLLLAIIVICNATIIPIEAVIGNNRDSSSENAYELVKINENNNIEKKMTTLGILSYFVFVHNYNYLLLAIIVICNATIIPIDAIIGNNKELS